MCELCHSVLRVLATTVCARTLTDGRTALGEVATFEIGGVGSILLTNTAVLWSGHTGHDPIVRQNYMGTGTDAMAECARSDTARTFWHASHSLTHLAHSIATSDPKLWTMRNTQH